MNRGKGVDKSTDVFSFGRFIYFVLTGNAPFKGRTRSEIVRFMRLATAPDLDWPLDWAGGDRGNGLIERGRPLSEECSQVDANLRPHMHVVHKAMVSWTGDMACNSQSSSIQSLADADPDGDDGETHLRETLQALRRSFPNADTRPRRHGRGRRELEDADPAAGQLDAASHAGTPAPMTERAREPPPAAERYLSATREGGVRGTTSGSRRLRPASPEPVPEAAVPQDGLQTFCSKFQPTPVDTRIAMVGHLLLHCNIERPAGTCCSLHAAAESFVSLCLEKIYKCPCRPEFLVGIRGQCQQCGCLFHVDDMNSQGESEGNVCAFCAEPLDMLSNGSLEHSGSACKTQL